MTATKSAAHTVNEQNKLVFIENDKPMTTSRLIAKTFGKNHKEVLRDIKNLGLPEDFNQRNFALVDYKDAKGELRPEYHITKDGFALLAFGYTGEKAMQFKISYIERFNEMEATLKTGVQFLKETEPPFAGLTYLYYAGEKLFVYIEVVKAIGFSTTSGAVSSRKKRMPNMFTKLFGRVLIAEAFAHHLHSQKALIEAENKLRQMELPFDEKEGGAI
jgi:Rha family phage regulatory protein